MSTGPKHISVCICTFRRPHLLKRLLAELEHQVVDNRFTYSLVVADNDSHESARDCVVEFAATSTVPTRYCPEPRQNIALARNKAVEHATGDFIAFIDDDEFPCRDWLQRLLNTCEQYGVDAVLGPVRPHFDEEPPPWIIRGGFCERPEYSTGRVIKWSEGRAGNILLRREVLSVASPPFDPAFNNGGEDMEFLRCASARGAAFVWCNEAAVYETVPPSRWTRRHMFKRALLRGKNILKHPTRSRKLRLLATSTVAVPLYLLALPVMSLGGQHLFMKYGIKLSEHLGRLLALVGLNPVSERDV